MVARLGFATALRADADILLLDEVLAVGDAHFQQKCLAVFDELRHRGTTLVLVSHDLHTVQRICDRAYCLYQGRVAYEGPSGEVVGMYLALSRGDGPSAGSVPAELQAPRVGDGRIRYVDSGLEDEHGSPVTTVRAGTRIVLRLVVEAEAAIDEPAFGFVIWRGGQIIYSTNSVLLAMPGAPFSPRDRATLRIPFTVALANGVYVVSAAAADRTGDDARLGEPRGHFRRRGQHRRRGGRRPGCRLRGPVRDRCHAGHRPAGARPVMAETQPPRVAVQILTWNRVDELVPCLESFGCIDYPNYEVIVLDNGSEDERCRRSAPASPGSRSSRTRRTWGSARATTSGSRHVLERHFDYVLLLNSDTKVLPGLLHELVAVMQQDARIAIAGAKNVLMENPDTPGASTARSRGAPCW